MSVKTAKTKSTSVAIVGGGVAGATAAVHFGELGIPVTLLERGDSLVNGPPICHLHAGGNLYREISEQQCIELLKQSIDSVRLFPHTINKRPTVLAIPKHDPGSPNEIIRRLGTIREAYQSLVIQDSKNQVLGRPDQYFKVYGKDDVLRLQNLELNEDPKSLDDWMIPFAKYTNLDKLQFPVVMVQEYGWSVFRLAASATLALEQMAHCEVLTNSNVVETHYDEKLDEWTIEYIDVDNQICSFKSKYLINACGYETGKIDDAVHAPRQRMVEFKSAYVARWNDHDVEWPEVIFHGQRGTPHGMAQFTPYGNGVFQLHGMTQGITLFEQGLVSSTKESAQPQLPEFLESKIKQGWDQASIDSYTRRAIDYLVEFIPQFEGASVESKPLFGAQQIPGEDANLRAADVSFEAHNYARMEVVKGSSALEAAKRMVEHWHLTSTASQSIETQHPISMSLTANDVEHRAIELAELRSYPIELAQVSGEQ